MRQMCSERAGFGEHREDVFESLLERGDKFVGLKPLREFPSHLARDEHDAAGRCLDAIGITDRAGAPIGGQQNAHGEPRCGRPAG